MCVSTYEYKSALLIITWSRLQPSFHLSIVDPSTGRMVVTLFQLPHGDCQRVSPLDVKFALKSLALNVVVHPKLLDAMAKAQTDAKPLEALINSPPPSFPPRQQYRRNTDERQPAPNVRPRDKR